MSLRIATIAMGAALFGAAVVQAQEPKKIEWAERLNVPKGQNMPAGVKADILGIELGAPYSEVRPIVEKWVAEGRFPAPLKESTKVFDLPIPGTKTQASYPALITAERSKLGSGKQGINETLTIFFSAPSSGHQVLRARRRIQYAEQGDQPRISEIVAALRDKFKTTPIVSKFSPDAERQIFIFNKGVPAATVACKEYEFSEQTSPGSAKMLNASRACDVALWVEFTYGISKDHAAAVSFNLFDNERARQNLTADIKFLETYTDDQVRKVREQTRGQPPKL